MQFPDIVADTDIGTLIYIIVVVIWVISSALSKSKKKKGKPPAQPRSGESTAEAELREFIESMTGQKVEVEPEAPAPPPRTIRVKEREKARQHIHVTPPAPKPRFVPEPEITMDVEKMARELRESAPSAPGGFSKTLSSRGSLFKTTGTTLPNFRYAFSSIRPNTIVPVLSRNDLLNKDDLRRIIAGQIIIGPPRAFDPYAGDSEITR